MNQSKEQAIFIPGPMGPLEAKFAPAATSKEGEDEGEDEVKANNGALGIVCHPHPLYQGSMENKVVTTIAKAWQEMGLATLRFNFRGVGKSLGEYGEGQGEQEDLRAVLNWALEQHPNTKFFLGGFSFGAFITSTVAATHKNEYPFAALLSVAPALRYFSFTIEDLPSVPWVVMQGDQDELVPYSEVLVWYQDIKSRKQTVELITFKDTSHFFHGRLNELKTEIKNVMKAYFVR